MNLRRLLGLVVANLRSSRVNAAFAIIGIAVGTAFLAFFIGLGVGLQERVLNRIFPATQLEIEPRSVRVFGVEQALGETALDSARIAQLGALPGVVRAFGKQKSAFPARLWGGESLLGYNLFTEAFFDGLPSELLRPELRESEHVDARRLRAARRPPSRCDLDIDCPPGQACDQGACSLIVWADRFSAASLWLSCEGVADCRDGASCVDGRCVGTCGLGPDQSGCAATCETGSCPAGSTCDSDAAPTRCVPQRCLVKRAEDVRGLGDASTGHVARRCDEGSLGWCATEAPCPAPTYCATDQIDSRLGHCEPPLPGVVNPLLLEVFNSDMAQSLGVAKMASPEALFGVRFHMIMGDSYFTKDAARPRQQIRQGVVVGFSRKAPELGLALPLEVVRHFNARFRGRQASRNYDAVVIETESNEVVPAVIAAVESHGFSLSRRSRVARTFGTVVFVVWLALVLLAVIVLLVAASSITHVFAMLVHERRREIAVLRAIGATRRAIALLVLGEAAILGVVGGLVGLLVARLGALAVDSLAGAFLAGVPLVPDAFFHFPWWSAPLVVGVAAVFCIVGALGPARRATRLDPAAVLSQP